MANTFIVLGVPKGFPCTAAAVHSLRAARETGMTRIRVEQPGCVCEFDVDALLKHVRQHRPLGDGLFQSGSVRGHRAMGNRLEPRRPTWRLPLSLQAGGEGVAS